VRFGVNFFDHSHVHMDVAHCGVNVGVPHQCLNVARIGAVLNEGRSEGMPELVRVDGTAQHCAAQALDDLVYALPS
jgi:hypothetical protein